jgi:hypothetical protein
VGEVACTPRRKEAVQGEAWGVGWQRRAWAPAKYGCATTGWVAQRGRAARADWASRAVAWRFRERHMDRRTKDWPRCADPTDRSVATATPARARALWSARVPTQLSLALLGGFFSKFLN